MLRYAADLLDAVQDDDTLPNIANDPSTAIGFANGLIFSAFDSIATMSDPKLVREVVTLFSKTAFQASHGQHLSLQRNGRDDITLESYWHATILKSGSIFRAGLGGGAIAGNAPDQYIAALDDFGNALGIIRQIIDDCRDVLEKTEIGAYEVTLPLLMLALRREESVVELMASFNSREALSAAFNESNVPETITSVLLEWHRRALESLWILERNDAVIALEGILTDFVTTPWWNLDHE
jgi:geranylgeranyl pyrophosphate synthase